MVDWNAPFIFRGYISVSQASRTTPTLEKPPSTAQLTQLDVLKLRRYACNARGDELGSRAPWHYEWLWRPWRSVTEETVTSPDAGYCRDSRGDASAPYNSVGPSSLRQVVLREPSKHVAENCEAISMTVVIRPLSIRLVADVFLMTML